MGVAFSTPKFSNFAHDCQGTEFNGDSTTVIGMNCQSESSNTSHTSWLNLDVCLSYESPNLVAHQVGGYVSTSNCTNCTGTVNDYSCYCRASHVWTWASIDLTTFIGVNYTNGVICCNAGTDEAPAVRCGDLQTFS
ncbi:hypothetical protein LA080_009514 [Diaporthe eres]|nr:hypothetical protein LA080_009514 [Diaporthe eres]